MPRTGLESPLDDAFRALAHDTRRQVLFRLLGPDPNAKTSVPEGVHVGNSAVEALRSTLHHHLPLLEELELILWDDEARTVSKGVKFDAVRPVLQCSTNTRLTSPVRSSAVMASAIPEASGGMVKSFEPNESDRSMVPQTLYCSNCRHRRLGQLVDGVVKPYSESCPECGQEGFELPSGHEQTEC